MDDQATHQHTFANDVATAIDAASSGDVQIVPDFIYTSSKASRNANCGLIVKTRKQQAKCRVAIDKISKDIEVIRAKYHAACAMKNYASNKLTGAIELERMLCASDSIVEIAIFLGDF